MMMTIQKHTQTDTHTYTTTVDLHRNFQAEYPEHTRTQRGTNKAKGNKIRHQILQNKRRNSPLEEARSRGSIKWRETGARESQKIGRSADLSVSLSLSLSLSERAHCSREALSSSSAAMELLSSSSWLFQGTGSPGETPGFCAMSPGSKFFYIPTYPSNVFTYTQFLFSFFSPLE